jgi:hypothetical protein
LAGVNRERGRCRSAGRASPSVIFKSVTVTDMLSEKGESPPPLCGKMRAPMTVPAVRSPITVPCIRAPSSSAFTPTARHRRADGTASPADATEDVAQHDVLH